MKQTTRLCVRASLVGFAIMNVSYAQIDVQSDGAFTIFFQVAGFSSTEAFGQEAGETPIRRKIGFSSPDTVCILHFRNH
ncbi:MAG: hypothetical protein IAB08_10150 [Bacteroidetes bacterium]|uniref:Uncharacterized protein n=1 Tax=Candidatus Pullibacteroides excrementavium TaxID=2840905 RepID=A0A9D9DYB5_9BACT|nr:hypothetical protein [Candidatus Pullibacteroides excrementavium]